jgi:hypothetical protein
MAVPPHDFSIYGLRVRSSLDLTDWPALAQAGDADVTITQEPVAGPQTEGPHYTARSIIENGSLRLGVQGVARYWATAGTAIRVDPDPDARPEDVQLYLTGAVLGAILHQRGLFPLHASCVSLNGCGIALAGPSGAGKSTLVAALVRYGATFVSDDLCVLEQAGDGTPRVRTSAARAKLDEAALVALDHSGRDLSSAGGNRGKYLVPIKVPPGVAEPVPLHWLYLIRDGEDPARTEPVEGLEAVTALVDETYFLRWAGALGLAEQCFAQAARVARNLQIHRLLRPRGFHHLNSIVQLIVSETGQP